MNLSRYLLSATLLFSLTTKADLEHLVQEHWFQISPRLKLLQIAERAEYITAFRKDENWMFFHRTLSGDLLEVPEIILDLDIGAYCSVEIQPVKQWYKFGEHRTCFPELLWKFSFESDRRAAATLGRLHLTKRPEYTLEKDIPVYARLFTRNMMSLEEIA